MKRVAILGVVSTLIFACVPAKKYEDLKAKSEQCQEDLAKLGNTPLPKYLNRGVEAIDNERYQTIYAKKLGAVAAPTAGLHFSRNLMKRLETLKIYIQI